MLAALLHVPVPVDDPRKDLGAAEVEADDAFFVQTARLPYWLDADRKRSPTASTGAGAPRARSRWSARSGHVPTGTDAGPREPKIRRPRRRWSWKRRIGVGLLVLLVLATVWGIAGYLSFRNGVEKANARLDKSVPPVLANQNGLLLSNPTTMLLLGRDHENTDQRVGLNNSDSIMILRTDPSRHRLVYLSIPRDLRVPIPGHGEDRINSAFPLGGAALTIRTIESLTGLEINHVMIVDFRSFKSLIDNIGGIDVNVPAPILSNKFDCPYKASTLCALAGLPVQQGDAAHERTARAHLLAHP